MRHRKAYFVLGCLLFAGSLEVSSLRGAEIKVVSSMALRTPAFKNGAEIPRKHTCDAEDVSPSLGWEKAPARKNKAANVQPNLRSDGIRAVVIAGRK